MTNREIKTNRIIIFRYNVPDHFMNCLTKRPFSIFYICEAANDKTCEF